VFNPTETKKERPGQNASKHSSTAQRLTLHSSVRRAACYEPKSYGDARGSVNGDHHRWWLCAPHEFTATLRRVAVQVRQQFFDAFYAGQASRRVLRVEDGDADIPDLQSPPQ